MQRASSVSLGIAQQLPARAEHDRQLAGIDVEALDQRPRRRVGLGIEALMGMAVAGEKSVQPQHVAIVGAADDDRPAGARLDQPDAAQDQGAHDPLAELGFRDQQRAQPVRRDDQSLDRSVRVGIDQDGPARELSELAHERRRRSWVVIRRRRPVSS